MFYILRGVIEGIFSRTAVLVSIKVSINLLNTLIWKELDTSLGMVLLFIIKIGNNLIKSSKAF